MFRLINRADFDAALVEAAVAAGAELRTGAVVTGIDDEPGPAAPGVTLQIRGGAGGARPDASSRADGSASRLGAYVGVAIGQVDLGLEGEFPAPDARWERDGPARLGAGSGLVRLGFSRRATCSPSASSARANTRRRCGRTTPGCSSGSACRASPRWCRPGTSPAYARRIHRCGAGAVLVAGDAAGLLEPWTREGISFALRSGRLAGEAAARGRLDAYPPAVSVPWNPRSLPAGC